MSVTIETLLILDVGVDEAREVSEISIASEMEELVGRGDIGETLGDGVE